MLNSLNVTAARQPRALVRINDTRVDGWMSWEVTQNTFYEADSFRVSFATSALPSYAGADWFSRQKELFVEILAGFPADPTNPQASELDSLIYGRVDDMEFEPATGMLSMHGRDLTAAFIDARVTEEWTNIKASDVATKLAAAHGLTPVVTATSTNVGTLYKRDQVRMIANRSEWDLLAWLAREEGFVCYVQGKELHFEPDTDTGDSYLIRWTPAPVQGGYPQANVQQLHFTRALTVTKGVTVTVRSASLKTKTAVVESYPTAAKSVQAGKASPFGGTQNYFFTLAAGADAAKCAAYAQAKYREIVSHEMRLQARLPGDNLLQARTPIVVEGTGTDWDQTYFPSAVTRQMSMDEGYTMTVQARNRSPETPQ